MSSWSEQDLQVATLRMRRPLKGLDAGGVSAAQKMGKPASSSTFKPFTIALTGQMISGKNRVMVRRDGKHIPRKQFINWRTDMHFQILEQRPALPPAITIPVRLVCQYWPGDRKTRDVDGQLSALFHLLVYAKVLKDDGLIYDCTWHRYQHADFPKLVLEIAPWT